MALFYSDGGPCPPTKLVRVNVEGNGSDDVAWRAASAQRWTVARGWIPYDNAQLDISFLGELFMVDASQVLGLQQQMRDDAAEFAD